MTGWGIVALLVCSFLATLLGFAWGAQWQRDEQKAQERFAADLERRRQVLPLTYQATAGDARRGFRIVHGGRR